MPSGPTLYVLEGEKKITRKLYINWLRKRIYKWDPKVFLTYSREVFPFQSSTHPKSTPNETGLKYLGYRGPLVYHMPLDFRDFWTLGKLLL